MSGPDHSPPEHHILPEQAEQVVAEAVAAVRRIPLRTRILIVLLSIVAGLSALVFGVRYGALLPQARLLIAAGADGLKVGRFGRLRIEGLTGDIFRDVSVAKLTISDEGGVWLEADNVHMTWSYLELLRRRFHAKQLEIQSLKLLRRPTLAAKGVDTGLPLSFHIDQAHTRVEMAPAFSYERGLYDLALQMDVDRNGDQRGKVRAGSLLHPGDYLLIDYDLAKKRPLMFRVDGVEAQGGALAGAIGLPSKQPFIVEATAGGRLSNGQFDAFANSGSTRVLKALGSWTPSGGVARGQVSLTASALTDSYAHRFGPKVSFVLAGQQAGKELFALDGRLASENLNLRARGFGDVGKGRVGPRGLEIAAETQALSRLTGGPDLGPARVTGTLTQSVARGRTAWRFAGSGAVSHASLGGYELAQASGPLEGGWAAGEWDLKAQLSGAGGRGNGYVAAMLGGAPRATFDGARLADGRLLLRDLSVTGSGL
ncbi:MAG: translocation/assembly module TamB, partial [Proteobacteria bacterium]|nr:translocation/assembly module TamB [Pseudomonadota bacterium]